MLGNDQGEDGVVFEMESNENKGRLNGRKITLLAHSVSGKGMEQIAKKYLNISHETIQNLRYENKENIEATTRNMIRYWARRNPEPDQVKVPSCIFCQQM